MRMGASLCERERSSRTSPLWMRRRAIEPVRGEEKKSENVACSEGAS